MAQILRTGLSENFSFTLHTSNDDSTIWKKYPFWLENVSSFKKQLSKIQSFLKSNLDITKYTKYCLHKTIKFGTLTQLTSFIFLL